MNQLKYGLETVFSAISPQICRSSAELQQISVAGSRIRNRPRLSGPESKEDKGGTNGVDSVTSAVMSFLIPVDESSKQSSRARITPRLGVSSTPGSPKAPEVLSIVVFGCSAEPFVLCWR